MSEINEIKNKCAFLNASWLYKMNFVFLMLFVLSLPFTAIEWDLIPTISRFEIKITMITFPLLFISWFLCDLKFPRKRNSKQILFYFFAFMYGMSQFTSLINSPLPSDSIIQGIIILSLLTMMIVISEAVLDKKLAKYVFSVIGSLSLLIGIIAILNFYLSDSHTVRLGQGQAVLGIIDIGGDPQYLGDIFLYSAGAVLFVSLQLYKRKYWKYVIWFCLILWYSAVTVTFVKALLLSILCFLMISLILMKGKRYFVILNLIVFILAIVANYHLITVTAISKTKTKLINEIVFDKVDAKWKFGKQAEWIEKILVGAKDRQKKVDKQIDETLARIKGLFDILTKTYKDSEKDLMEINILIDNFIEDIGSYRKGAISFKDLKDTSDRIMREFGAKVNRKKMTNEHKRRFKEYKYSILVELKGEERSKRQDRVEIGHIISSMPENIREKLLSGMVKSKLQVLSRLNVFGALGANSISVRLKAVVVSVLASLDSKWFGHGAGLSQKLLPEMGNMYDKMSSDDEKGLMKRLSIYGETVNISLIDSHVFFLTEFFNVGLIGLISLMALIVFIIIEQIKTMKVPRDKNDKMNELLFSTLLSMLIYRLAGSFVVIPFLWFILGLSFGVCRLYWKGSSVSAQE